MRTTREVESSVLRNWLENEEEINGEYNALEKALEELDDIYHSDKADDERVEVRSRELILRGYKALSRNRIKETGIDTLLEEYKEELRGQIIIMNLYHEVKCFSQVVSDEVIEEAHCATAVTIVEFKKGDLKLRVIHVYELILNEANKEQLAKMTKDEKHDYVVANGNCV